MISIIDDITTVRNLQPKVSQELLSDGEKSPRFERYEEIMERVQAAVRTKLESIKQNAPRKERKVAESRDKRDRHYSESSDSEIDELNWEVDSDVSAYPEEVIDFRLNLIQEPNGVSVIIIDAQESDVPAESTYQRDIPTQTTLQRATSSELRSEFDSQLSSSQVLVDFQERYIQKRLATERESPERKNDASLASQDAQASWREITETRPEFALASLRQLSEAAQAVANNSSAIDVHTQRLNIQDVTNQEVDVKLSARSKEYARFIPTFSPRLDFDS